VLCIDSLCCYTIDMTKERVVLGELELSQLVVAGRSGKGEAGDGCVSIRSVIDSFSSAVDASARRAAEARTVPLTTSSPANRKQRRWQRPLNASPRKKRPRVLPNTPPNTIYLPGGIRRQNPGSGYLLVDISKFLDINLVSVTRLARAYGLVRKIPKSRYYAPLTRAQAKKLIAAFRLPPNMRGHLL
jgi:hypothetical protein